MENKIFPKIKNDLHNFYAVIIGFIVYALILQLIFNTICPIKAIFKIDCPGCGLTHATIYLMTGQINKAIEANYTVFFWWTFIILFAIDRYIYKFKIKIVPTIFAISCIITLFRYMIIIYSTYHDTFTHFMH